MDFASLDLPEPVMQGIREAGFVTATPIQEAALPLALRGKDVAGQAQTGTGKTAAFLIAAFHEDAAHAGAPAPGRGRAAHARHRAHTRAGRADRVGRAAARTVHAVPTLAVYGGIDYNKQRESLAAAAICSSARRPSV